MKTVFKYILEVVAKTVWKGGGMAELLHLVRANASNRLFEKLKSNWDKQIEKLGIPSDGYKSAIEYAEKIVQEPQDNVYGIYVLCGGDRVNATAPYEAFIHVNHKLPKTSAAEIRLVWNRFAPKYFDPARQAKLPEVYMGIIYGGLSLAQANVKCNKMRMYLANDADLRFAQVFAPIFTRSVVDRWAASVRGQWLHFERRHPK